MTFESPLPNDDAAAATAAHQNFISSRKHSNASPRQPIWSEGMQNSRGAYPRKFRGNSRNVLWTNRDVAEKVQATLQATYDGDASIAKSVAIDAGASARAAENWLAADNPMSLTAFLNAYHANTTFKAWARKLLLLEQDQDPEFQAQLALFVRAAQRAGGS